ncbi:P-loop containing nucleoside triphosphate hydrolase protein [Fimicolochytrium jonesii]|uniref:P-loop containing nucleoside triphosphate hydrolase protein n=1 Tax=Fimicolochytrium jonesii TaxID=1396493 RepID=UPI0022FE2F00|nr:P-loop containing nucleoside triphosphate hydrolase protein [Fimicolochytrium jonesii]KAI8826956.1 P-loop containing nucleoside triphosphate hydrolase protein [Fimicolochytrium jonesii]
MINRQGVAAKPVSRGIPIRTPGDNRPQALRQLSTLNKIVLQWNYDMEGEKPPDFPFDLKNIPNTFQGGEQEYVSVFEPLLVLECWEQMQKSKYEVDRGDALTFKLTNVQTVDVFHDLTFTAPGKQMRLRGYSEHDVLNVTDVEVPRQGHESTSGKSFLAKITNVSFKADEGIVIARVYMSVNAALAPRLRAGAKFSLLSTFSMTTSIREYGTLCALPSLCLLKDVLRPGKIRKFHPRPDDVRLMMTRYNLNEPQAAAISGAVAQSTGFTLIQGPPGTGKTKTIVGLISALLTRENVVKVPGQAVTPNSKHRLLCCAPSNAAIDEIVRRLKEGIPHPRGGTFVPRVVRIGTTESIHTSVRDVTLEAILEGILATTGNFQEDDRMADIRSAITSLKDERERLRAREDDNEIEAEEASKVDAKISTITKKLAALHEQLQRERQEKTAASQARDKYRRQQKLKVLMEADVILSTLSGAGSDVLGDLHELTFPIVIVDEAAQSVELSTLIPLRYGAKQCILVGDPQQLPPTVLSQVGQSYSYEQSLFQRLMNNDPDGTHLLSISYRMHPSISSYVSKGFYKGRLRDAPNMSELCTAPWHKDSMFAPYQLIDMYNGREQTGRGHSYFNLDEARLAVDLVEVLCSRFPDYNFAGKIGIITFYKKQVREIKNTFIRKGWTREMMQNIDVNTVDGFQGQEKEIIILSCVRANGSVGFTSDIRRMNVALSRAKYSLIILGNLETLKRNRAWRDLIEDAAGRRMIKSWTERLSRLRDEVRGRPGNMLPRVEAPQGDGANDGERKTERKRERSDEQGSDTGKAGRKVCSKVVTAHHLLTKANSQLQYLAQEHTTIFIIERSKKSTAVATSGAHTDSTHAFRSQVAFIYITPYST